MAPGVTESVSVSMSPNIFAVSVNSSFPLIFTVPFTSPEIFAFAAMTLAEIFATSADGEVFIRFE